MESRSQLESKGMEKTVANSEDASVFLLSRSQQREHTDCEGESVCYVTEIHLQKEQAQSLSHHGCDVMKQLYPALP